MNKAKHCLRFAAVAAAALLGGGCLNFKQTADPTRFYVLSPLPPDTAAPAGATAQLAIGLGRVDVPSYLTDPRMSVREGHEIRYSEFHQWAERMDKGIQRVLAANLSRLVASNGAILPTWNRRDVAAELYVAVQQFEPDPRGHVTVAAAWRITSPGGELIWHTGQARLRHEGPSVEADAEGATSALSAALAELSRQIADSVRSAVKERSREAR